MSPRPVALVRQASRKNLYVRHEEYQASRSADHDGPENRRGEDDALTAAGSYAVALGLCTGVLDNEAIRGMRIQVYSAY